MAVKRMPRSASGRRALVTAIPGHRPFASIAEARADQPPAPLDAPPGAARPGTARFIGGRL